MPSSSKCCASQLPATPIEKGNANKKPKNNIRIDLLNVYVFDSPYFWLTTIIFMLSISSDSDQPIVFYINRISRSEEHTSELQSRAHLVCRLLLEKKK